jgi:hypothetical protein
MSVMGILQQLTGFPRVWNDAWPNISSTTSLNPLISLNNYSQRTVCPECNGRVRLEDVRFGPRFPCPSCGKDIRISDRYQVTLKALGWILGILLPFGLGVRSWFLLICWVPCTMALFFIWMWTGKYLIPPRLQSCVFEPPSILGLGRGPR